MRKEFFTICFLLSFNLMAQYTGGSNSGYFLEEIQSIESLSIGGEQDGYAFDSLFNMSSISVGGNGDGYEIETEMSNTSLAKGNVGDGYDVQIKMSDESISKGGSDDGYDLIEQFYNFIWTGNINSDWNNINNWHEPWVPDFNSTVVIPNNTDNFPKINSGVLRIAYAGGDYSCRSLQIEADAEMTIGPFAYIQNNGRVNIVGALFVENPNLPAFWNLGCGSIYIRTGGQLIFQP